MLALGLLAAACTKPTLAAGPSASTSSSPSPSPVSSEPSASPSPPGPDLGSVHVHLQKIATLDQPLGMAVRAGDDGLYIAEKTGRIVALRNGNVDPRSEEHTSELQSRQ